MDKKNFIPNNGTEITEKEDLKDRILEVALAVFAEKGYANTSMQDIADGAGISRGPLYYYYSTKADLFYHVFIYSGQSVEDMVTQVFSAPDPFFKKAENELEALLSDANREGERVREIVRSNPDQHPECYQQLVNSRKVIRYIKKHSVKQAITQGELHPETDPEALIDLLFVFHRGVLSERIYWDETEARTKPGILVQEFIEMLRSRYGA